MNMDEPYNLYVDKRRWFRCLHKALFLTMVPMLFVLFVLWKPIIAFLAVPLPPHPKGIELLIALFELFISFFPWIAVFAIFIAYVAGLIRMKQQQKPIVVLTRHGIRFDMGSLDASVIPWNEIAEVRLHRFIYRCIGFVPRDLTTLCGLVDKRLARLLWLREIYRLPLRIFLRRYKSKKVFAPFSIAQDYISVPLDELMEIIGGYRLAYVPKSPYGAPQEGVWPPPPDPSRLASLSLDHKRKI